MNAIVERVLCCILFLLVVFGVIVMHINPDEDEEADIVETQESTTCEEKETVIAPLPDYPLIESKRTEIIGGHSNEGNGMPCEVHKVPEETEESEEETNEPETREEAKQETESTAPTSSPQGTTAPVVGQCCGGTDGNTVGEDSGTSGETVAEQTETAEESDTECELVTESTESVAESATETPTQEESTEAPAAPAITYYSVNGAVLDLDIQRHLYQRLAEKGIGWFMPYAILIAYQESRFNPRAENVNGQDKGLFQYRLKFYSGSDIFNPYEQIDIFSQQMANRANAGCSVQEMISRHMMSDYGAYNQSYVDQVMQHEGGLAVYGN